MGNYCNSIFKSAGFNFFLTFPIIGFILGMQYQLFLDKNIVPVDDKMQNPISNKENSIITVENKDIGVHFSYPYGLTYKKDGLSPQYLVVNKVLSKPTEPYEEYSFRIGKIKNATISIYETYIKEYYNPSSQECGKHTPLVKTKIKDKIAYNFKQLDCHNTDSEINIVYNNGGIYYIGMSATGKNKSININKAKNILDSLTFLSNL